jgi:hypothetical protein
MLIAPWIFHDVELALWPAGMDGHLLRGPGGLREQPAPLFHCKSSLTITQTFDGSAATGHDWRNASSARDSSWQIQIEFTDGAIADEYGRVFSALPPGGFRILTLRFLDEVSGQWTLLAFYYIVPVSDADGVSGQVMSRTVTLRSSYRQERIGSAAMPSLMPQLFGEVEWVCGSHCIPAFQYFPETETWVSLPRNDLGNGTRYVNISPVSDDPGADLILSCYLPRVNPLEITGDELASAGIVWQNTIIARIGNHESATHHGLILQAGHTLQATGITEPLMAIPQSRMIDEPVIVFRFLRRIYATIGHGVLAVPRLITNEDPPVVHDPAFRLAVPGDLNPATDQSGLVLLPNGAWLDGTVQQIP